MFKDDSLARTVYCVVNTTLRERDICVCLNSVLYRNSVFCHIAVGLYVSFMIYL